MKYSIHDYAKALDEAIANPKANKTDITKNFLELVRRNGDEARLKKILIEAERLSRGREKGDGESRAVLIESARPLSKTQEKTLQQFVRTHDSIEYRINPSLIAGIRITINDEMQFDGTMKAKLDTLFT